MRGARAGFVFWLMTAAVAHAQDVSVFPNKPIRFVVPFQPGGGTELVVFDRKGDSVEIEAGDEDAILFVMHGVPIDESVVCHGPFVMTASKEIREAFVDFQFGNTGKVPEEEVTA